jgi:hypothetical protein
MHKSIGLIVIAMLASAALMAAGGWSPAAARIKGGAPLLNVCIANYYACQNNCNFWFPLPPPNSCSRMCDANHAACVDLAYGGNANAARRGPGKKPRHVQ